MITEEGESSSPDTVSITWNVTQNGNTVNFGMPSCPAASGTASGDVVTANDSACPTADNISTTYTGGTVTLDGCNLVVNLTDSVVGDGVTATGTWTGTLTNTAGSSCSTGGGSSGGSSGSSSGSSGGGSSGSSSGTSSSGGSQGATCTSNEACTSACCAVENDANLDVVCSAASQCNGGIGDECTSNSQCSSGICANGGSGTGWCTEACSSSNALCYGSHVEDSGKLMLNQFGQLNWCVANSATTYSCFPGCSNDAECTAFPGTTCVLNATTVTGFPATGICTK